MFLISLFCHKICLNVINPGKYFLVAPEHLSLTAPQSNRALRDLSVLRM